MLNTLHVEYTMHIEPVNTAQHLSVVYSNGQEMSYDIGSPVELQRSRSREEGVENSYRERSTILYLLHLVLSQNNGMANMKTLTQTKQR